MTHLTRVSISGVIKDGQVIPEETILLPAGTRVRIEPVPESSEETLAEAFREFMGACEGLPSDLAANHDHYLHGAPRQ